MDIIKIKNLSFSYKDGEDKLIPVLKNIDMSVKEGEFVAVLGHNGSGKSTILNLIPRLQDPTSGEILINGENIKNFNLKSLRDKISFTPQKAILFQGTVKSYDSFYRKS